MIFGFKEIKFRTDDDFADRLTRRHSVCLMLLFSLIITTKQYVGEPIFCWCPAQFTSSHKEYANTICWVKNTYHVPFEDDIPKPTEHKAHISYYQWVPMILLAQSLMCYLPSIMWRYLCRRSGLNVSAIMDAAIAGQKTSYADIRDKTTRYIVHQIDGYLLARSDRGDNDCFDRFKRAAARYCCIIYGKAYGNYLSICYLVVKLLYVCNAIGQLYLLDVFLGTDYHIYGIDVVRKFVYKDDWTVSQRFPRVTLCDFQIRHQNMLHRYVVQCVLPINLFNEKIFIFIWFWYALLCLITIMNFIKWIWNVTVWPVQNSYVSDLLRSIGAISNKRDAEAVEKFTQRYLKRDGVFIVRLIGSNLGHLVSSEVMGGLWENFGPEQCLLKGEGGVRPVRARNTAIRLNSFAERLDAVWYGGPGGEDNASDFEMEEEDSFINDEMVPLRHLDNKEKEEIGEDV